MGLIVAAIAPFAGGWNCNMFSPTSFIKNPILWVQLMSTLKVNFSIAPDFGYNLTARKFIEKKMQLGGQEPIPNLDLSSVILLQSAAEPIREETKDLFERYNIN